MSCFFSFLSLPLFYIQTLVLSHLTLLLPPPFYQLLQLEPSGQRRLTEETNSGGDEDSFGAV
ncbi:hypothetical protein P167DRAFT_537665 [Morchella conica CCBAS932]|uniref:Uncharacterized protein n=1 Tax=Morchella conica CCBAS932 TaxID=1392247 RepID=A0A3N4KIV0_9PEZI|nr:hypothetical protein P167DRAFT_537665 [Morchella conica CCBAS932]